MHSDPLSYEEGSLKRAAAVANQYMGAANNGGLNSFLTVAHHLDGAEVVHSLIAIGAPKAAAQLETVLRGLGTPLPATSQESRWDLLDERWSEELDQYDVLTGEADVELMSALSRHVADNEAFYSSLD